MVFPFVGEVLGHASEQVLRSDFRLYDRFYQYRGTASAAAEKLALLCPLLIPCVDLANEITKTLNLGHVFRPRLRVLQQMISRNALIEGNLHPCLGAINGLD